MPTRLRLMRQADAAISNWREHGPPVPASEIDAAHVPFVQRLMHGAATPVATSPSVRHLQEVGFQTFRTNDASALIELLAGDGAARRRAIESAERLMRYCEVHRFDLDRRTARKWGDRKAARVGLLAIAALLGEASLVSGDLRFANTALKLLEGVRTAGLLAFGEKPTRRAGDIVASHAILACHAALRRAGIV